MDEKYEEIMEFGQVMLGSNREGHKILFLSVIGEIEGHNISSAGVKSTGYEHLLPILAKAQDDGKVEGILILVNTAGGDCSCGLALSEMIASVDKPVASLIIGDCHSIGVPLAAAADHTVIAPTATVIVHPVRLSGTVIGAPQTFEYFKLIQDRITEFTAAHSKASKGRLEEMMIHQGIMAKDLGTILVGKAAVEEGLADEVGGIREALCWLHAEIRRRGNANEGK